MSAVEEDAAPILESLLGARLGRALLGQPSERRDLLAYCAFCALLFVPWLGATGLWDPWETHYGEVARQMVLRRDYVYPYWESAWFFSKPVLLMWLMSLGLNVVGTGDYAPDQPLPLYTEWAMRLPVAVLAIAGAALLFLAIRRIAGPRLAWLFGLVLATSPHYFLLARQCMEDMPLLACVEGSLACFLVAEFTPDARPVWWYGMYAFAAFGALAKESLGIILPGLVVCAYLLLSWDWALLRRARLLPGLVLFLLVAGPWYLTLLLFDGLDDESSTFALRLVHDNGQRFFTSSVHTTTPAWTFTYFIEQLGWGFFPWVALLPGALGAVARLDLRARDPQSRLALFFAGWAVAVFTFFSFSGTKFHHYIFPALPGLAYGVALFVDRLWREGLERWGVALLAGLGLLGLVGTNLYSWHEDAGPHSGLKHLTDLFVYNYGRPYPYGEDHPEVFAGLCAVGGLGVLLGFLWRSKGLLFRAFGGLALALAMWGSWFFWRWMSPHWSQRDEFWAYYQERVHNEPIAAYLMNWRGETFYSRNQVQQITDPAKLRAYLAQPGPEYVLVEQLRYPGMVQLLGNQYRCRVVDRSSNKFFMVEVSTPCAKPSDCPAPQACDPQTAMCLPAWEVKG